MAHRFESTDVFNNPKEEPLEKCVERETNGYGADVVIVACPVGAAQEQATHLVKPRGTVVLFGGLPKDNCHVSFDSNLIHYKELNVVGGFAYAPDVFAKAVELIVDKKIDAAKFVTHIMPLKDIKEGIKAIKTGEAIKVVLKPWE